MIEDFPGNSRRPVAPSTPPSEPEDSRPKLKPVVTGQVITRKKPLGRRMMDVLFSTDSNSLGGYLVHEVVVPTLKNLIADFVTQGVQKAVYGEVRTPSYVNRGTPTAQRTLINYNQQSTTNVIRPTPAVRTMSQQRPVAGHQPGFNLGECIVATKIEAQTVVDQLYETVESYGTATVANLRELMGQTPAYTDHKWGWTDLSTMTVKHIREGYLIMLPDPEDLR